MGHCGVARRPWLPLSAHPPAPCGTKQLSPCVQLNSALLPGYGMLRHQFMAPVGHKNRAISLREGKFSVE